jgi:catechol 2,3-dioxygenase-like lactoylglutathione lyase family enzyme
MHIDHVTIRTRDIGKTRDFFVDLFDLEEGARPKAIQRIPGYWLYANDKPIVHIIGAHGGNSDPQTEAIDHVGLKLEGYLAFRKKLEDRAIRYSTMDIPELTERRLFFRAPGGVLLEAVFSEPIDENDHDFH